RARVSRPKSNSNQQGLFSKEELKKSAQTENTALDEIEEFSDEEIQSLERQLLGLSLSAKPVSELISEFEHMATHKITEIFHREPSEENIKIAAVISDVRVVTTKRSQQEMAFVRVSDGTGSISLVVFPRIFQSTRSNWVSNKPLLVSGRVDVRDEEPSLVVNQISSQNDIEDFSNELYIKIPKTIDSEGLKRLRMVLLENPGKQSVKLMFEKNNKSLNLNIKVAWSESLARKISNIVEGDFVLD
ncbi:MAG TPA: OB-fold nucleic acid binding domain-containing protein, partial [Candidatus Dojkabacteria bacterium]